VLGDLGKGCLGVGEFIDDLFSSVDQGEGCVNILDLLVEVGSSVVSSGGDEFDLFFHDLLVCLDSNQIGCG
jgi:hypothetical protein